MPDEFLNIEETVSNLLHELSRIRNANEQIDKLEKISIETSKIADTANSNSLQLISRGKNIFDQIEKAKLETNLILIQKQLRENKKFVILLIILQIVVLAVVIIFRFI
jgi:hypothetical protein